MPPVAFAWMLPPPVPQTPLLGVALTFGAVVDPTVTTCVAVHPFASRTVTVYMPPDRLLNVPLVLFVPVFKL